MTTKSDEIMTPEEIAGMFGMNVNTVYRELNNGTLPGRKIGRKWYASKTRLMQWLQEPKN